MSAMLAKLLIALAACGRSAALTLPGSSLPCRSASRCRPLSMLLSGGDDEGGGRRSQDKRTEVEKLFDVGMRFEGLGALFNGLSKSGLGQSITPGCVVVARYDVPTASIVASQAYEVQQVYWQGLRNATVERVPVESVEARAPAGCERYTQYVKLFSADYHTAPVIVRVDEAGLVTVREEILDSLAVGGPILGFWLAVCASFLMYGAITTPI